MSKVITSPIKRWAGTVTIADPLTIPQAQLIEDGANLSDIPENKSIWWSVIDEKRLPAILGCVEKWELENFTPDPFPASPRGDSHKLVDWIFAELLQVYKGEAEVPNE